MSVCGKIGLMGKEEERSVDCLLCLLVHKKWEQKNKCPTKSTTEQINFFHTYISIKIRIFLIRSNKLLRRIPLLFFLDLTLAKNAVAMHPILFSSFSHAPIHPYSQLSSILIFFYSKKSGNMGIMQIFRPISNNQPIYLFPSSSHFALFCLLTHNFLSHSIHRTQKWTRPAWRSSDSNRLNARPAWSICIR